MRHINTEPRVVMLPTLLGQLVMRLVPIKLASGQLSVFSGLPRRYVIMDQYLIKKLTKAGWIGLVPVTWWRHQMETFSALLAICAGNSPVPGEFPAQRPVTRSFDVFFDLRLINGWVNNRKAGDLRRYRAHYDVMVMKVRVAVLYLL